MADYLKEFCDKTNIQLVYTNNKFKAASINVSDTVPKLRVHNLFKGCPKGIADAIISFYIKLEDSNNSRRIIEDYLSDNYPSENFYLTSPKEDIRFFFINQVTPSPPSDIENKALKELDILNIYQIDIKGNFSNIDPGDSMYIDEGEVLEVNVTVNEDD